MKVAVLGLWHLGSVTAACSADAGHLVVGYDPDVEVVTNLGEGRPPVAEPGLAELVRSNVHGRRLHFTSDLSEAVSTADVVWICFDTPVNDQDEADVDLVIDHVAASFKSLPHDAVVLTSSQLPVGSVKRIEGLWARVSGGRRVSFACSPENLRLGKAIPVFKEPDRVVIGVRDERARARLTELFAPITSKIEWMTVESAEMTKHAINAFLATSVSFINELATLCEVTGADARQVERGLKTEKRIGPYAYLAPGGAVAGGTLARDVKFLQSIGDAADRPTPLFDGLVASNTSHRQWARRRLSAELGSLAGRTVAVWGLTYKPGTDTLRRSEAIELCKWLVNEGAIVRVHDPVVPSLPSELAAVQRVGDPVEALRDASALVIATEWPDYTRVDVAALANTAPADLMVLDANRFLARTFEQHTRCRVFAVGQPSV
jgi:UDPglucose 6-dehydrogenase